MYDFLTRDNKQLRGQIFEFLKVSWWFILLLVRLGF